MSKDIWHTADEIPEPYKSFIIKTKNGNIYTGILTKPEEWNPLILPEFYSIGDIDKADTILQYAYVEDLLACEQELIRTRKALDKGMEHITGLNNMIESWYKLLQSDIDTSTKYAILKSAISAYVETKGGDNE